MTDETTTRRPPYSEEAEKGILGSILQDWEDIPDLCVEKRLYQDDFYVPALRIIYEAMGELAAKERPIDVLTVANKLKESHKLDAIGGEVFLHRLIDSTPTTAHVEEYIDIVKTKSLGRKIIQNCREGENAVYDGEDMELVRSEIEAAFTQMERKAPPQSLSSVIDKILSDVDKGVSGEPPEIGISTGYFCMDELSPGGMRNGSPYWLSGKAKAGKTSMKCNIIERLLMAGRKVADLTLEMTVEEELKKLAGIHCDRDITSLILNAKKDAIKPQKLEPFMESLRSSGHFFIEDQSTVSNAQEFRSWARRVVTKYGVEIIFVDYVQKLGIAGSERMKIEEQTSKQVDAVTTTAGMLGVPILGVVEENDGGGVRGSQRGDYAGAGHWQLSRANPKQKPEAPGFAMNLTLSGKVGRYGPSGGKKTVRLTGSTGLIVEDEREETQPELA